LDSISEKAQNRILPVEVKNRMPDPDGNPQSLNLLYLNHKILL
jgi:hypothetical protein